MQTTRWYASKKALDEAFKPTKKSWQKNDIYVQNIKWFETIKHIIYRQSKGDSPWSNLVEKKNSAKVIIRCIIAEKKKKKNISKNPTTLKYFTIYEV